MDDRKGDLEDAIHHVLWLIERIDTLRNVTRHDVKDAMANIREFNLIARVIRIMEDNHAGEYQPNRISVRTM